LQGKLPYIVFDLGGVKDLLGLAPDFATGGHRGQYEAGNCRGLRENRALGMHDGSL
jgi:hypothetical protein